MSNGIRVLIHESLVTSFKDFLAAHGERLDGPYSEPGGKAYYIIRKTHGGTSTHGVNGFGTTQQDPGEVVR